MKLPWTSVAIVAIATFMATTQLKANPPKLESRWSAATEGVIKERLEEISLPFDAKYNGHVKDLIKRYLTTGYRDAEAVLGRSVLYFPVFEHYLSIYQLPTELRYLPMVESNLRPDARSEAGAVGLWQFIPSTARHYSLLINGNLDERHDPYKSTEAAVKMLAKLYEQFGDWTLVLAAYNCGPGRVERAIRYAGSTDFWQIQQFLPKETQRYIPAFIAAAYIANFYNLHGLNPKYPSYDMQETRTMVVHDYVRFQDISFVSGVKISTLQQLNPGYIQGIVPQSKTGNYLVLPKKAVLPFRKLMAEKTGKREMYDSVPPAGKFKTFYVVAPGDDIEKVARLFSCRIDDIMKWNHLGRAEVIVSQELILFLPKNSKQVRP